LSSLIICNEEIDINEYENIIYDNLFSLINDLLEDSEDSGTFQIADENIF